MSGWDDLVTTALLGTERRPLPTGLPPAVTGLAAAQPDAGLAVLDAAAGYAAYRHAGARPGTCPEPGLAPRQDLDFAPERAQRLLRTLLGLRESALTDTWLRTCTRLGLGVRPRLWAALASAAVPASGPDRGLVTAALGERGRAFVALNPAWRLVARAWPPPAPGPGWSAEQTGQALAAVRVGRTLGRRKVVVEATGARDLRRAVAGADLGAWSGHTGLDPEAFLDVLRGTPWHDHVVAGLVAATLAQDDDRWRRALLDTGRLDTRAQQQLGFAAEIRRSFGPIDQETT
jgi:hypothetical protein